MAGKRGNPATGNTSRVLSQHVVNPQADTDGESSVDGTNPAKMKVPVGKKTVISQRVFNPSASNKGGGK
jgi:hypothetical protein